MQTENQSKPQEQHFPPNTLRASIPWFITFTVANYISYELMDLEAPISRAPLAGAISTALIYGVGKISTRN